MPLGNSNLFHYIYRSLMVTDPKEMVAYNCPCTLVKNEEIIDDYSDGLKKEEKI